jgi:ATP-dependent RNA circularization protein (DNA/RNA ligase family)
LVLSTASIFENPHHLIQYIFEQNKTITAELNPHPLYSMLRIKPCRMFHRATMQMKNNQIELLDGFPASARHILLHSATGLKNTTTFNH